MAFLTLFLFLLGFAVRRCLCGPYVEIARKSHATYAPRSSQLAFAVTILIMRGCNGVRSRRGILFIKCIKPSCVRIGHGFSCARRRRRRGASTRIWCPYQHVLGVYDYCIITLVRRCIFLRMLYFSALMCSKRRRISTKTTRNMPTIRIYWHHIIFWSHVRQKRIYLCCGHIFNYTRKKHIVSPTICRMRASTLLILAAVNLLTCQQPLATD